MFRVILAHPQKVQNKRRLVQYIACVLLVCQLAAPGSKWKLYGDNVAIC
jgi:hypothetical protein